MKHQRQTTWKVRKREQNPHFQEVCNLRFSSPRQVPQDLATRYSVKSQVPSAKCQVPQDLATKCKVSSLLPVITICHFSLPLSPFVSFYLPKVPFVYLKTPSASRSGNQVPSY